MIKQKVLGAILAFMTALALPLPAFAAGLNGAELSIGWVLPFAGILLCIAPCARWRCRISGTATTAR